MKNHCADLELQIQDLKQLIDRAKTIQMSLANLGMQKFTISQTCIDKAKADKLASSTSKDLGQSVFNTNFLELLDQYENKTKDLNTEVQILNKELKNRVQIDLDVYK